MGGSGRFAKMASKTFDPKKASKFTQRVINETPPMGRQQLQEGGKLKKKLKKIGRVLAGKAPEDGSGDYLLGNKKRRARNERQAKEMYPKSGGSASAKKAMERKRAEGIRNLYKLEKQVDRQVGVMGKPLNEDQREANKTRSADRQIRRYRARPAGKGSSRMRTLLTEPGKLVKRQKQFNIGGALLSGGLSAVGKKLIDGEKMDMKELGKTALGGAMTGAASAIPFKKGGKFKALVRKLMKEGKSKKNAQGIAAIAGRKKYGAKKFASMAAAGRRKRG
jgi:hypothetical protein